MLQSIIMKTGTFIQAQYDKEIARILNELVVAEKQLRAEVEILALQAKIKLHEEHREGAMVVHFNTGGSISIYMVKRGNWINLLNIHADPRYRTVTSYAEELEGLHLKELKSIQPKRAAEIMRMMAKKFLLIQESPTKRWWEFWKN